ncbi:YbfB/YjiJ family MFS transporter [Burkholderia cepacia]|uniref:YbfB/YjiJ family MFS transporter n=1 Tax=Burkholderia cepacia TaxID=292 RepID=UPI00160321B2|nr:YbfB/YjiJ family MFS transporter [Burkholderia cepacia]MBB0114233.1 YbfB/YjiJ family MFS transporter [Burkholderia cepacia]MBX4064167.1 YbfB/YjiJ family MFS transporter [Burkholderia cepacia]
MSRSDAPSAAAGAPSVDDTDRRARAVALACMVGLAIVLGVGRFAFTPLLPLMLADGSIGLKAGGWLASANYAGYFVGAVSCAALRVAPARMVRVGLVATVLLTAAMGVGHLLPVWLAVRFVAGVVSAWTFVFMSQWGLRRLAELVAPEWSGVIYAGPGVGIVVTGLIGSGGAGARAAAGGGGAPHDARRHRADAAWLVVLYGMPGFGYIITATFLPVIARAALPAGSPWPDLFWPMFGAALIVGAVSASRLPGHWDNRLLLAAGCATQALGIAAGIVWPNAAGFSVGSMLLGLPFTAITLFAMREARRLHGERAAGLMGYATASYGVGQIAGPLVAAPLVARYGSFTPALWVAAAALLAGAAGFVAMTAVAGAHRRRA